MLVLTRKLVAKPAPRPPFSQGQKRTQPDLFVGTFEGTKAQFEEWWSVWGLLGGL